MKISFKGDYALKTMLDLALRFDSGEVAPIRDISERQDIPLKYLEQILVQLKSGGFVRSKRGTHGGYVLARPPKEISMGEVIRFTEGPISPITCVSHSKHTECPESATCVMRPIFEQIRDRICDIVDHTTFEDLADRVRKAGKSWEEMRFYI